MAKLNQIIAVVSGRKTQAERTFTDAYQLIQKADGLSGISRTYKPKDDDGDTLPSESKIVQVKTTDLVNVVKEQLTDLMDLVATQDYANCEAKADITIDGLVLAENVPATHLLFLAKKLIDIQTFISKLPTLDPGERWSYDEGQDCYVSGVSQTTRSKKVMKNHVKAEATDKFPAQVDVYHEDIVVGTWSTVKFSGAIPVKTKNDMLQRVKALSDAVKTAREDANSIGVSNVKIAESLLGYVFGG